MKAIKLCVFAAGILLMGILNSCDPESKAFPATVSFTNNTSSVTGTDTVFIGDSFTLRGSVTGEGTIESVQFYRSYNYNYIKTANDSLGTKDTTVIQDSVVMAATEILSEDIVNNSCTFSVAVANLLAPTTITVVVNEKGGHKLAYQSLINVRTANITKHKNVNLGGWKGAGKSGIDLETGTMYGCGTADQAAAFPVEDIYFDYAQFSASDLDGVLHYNGVPRFTDLGTRFASTSITPAQFDTYKADDAFKSMTGSLLTIDIAAGNVIFFQTKGGKKGLIKIISLDAPDGDAFFDYMIQK
jgi:hypothetical protein